MDIFILVLLTLTGLFLMFIILLQRGRGGGLAGALGGAGGQSAFGTKAGDVFTRITIGVALFWVVLACVSIFVVTPDDLYKMESAVSNDSQAAISTTKESDAEKPSGTLGGGVDAEQESGGIDLDAIKTGTKPAGNTPDKQPAPPAEKK